MAGYIGSKTSVVSSGVERKKTYSITGSTTSLTGLNYTVGKVHVFQNGVRLLDGTDYTATNGTSITLTVAAQSGDNVVVVSQAAFQLSESYTSTESDARYVEVAGDTMTGNLNVTGTVTADNGSSTGQLNGNSLVFDRNSANYIRTSDAAGYLRLQTGSGDTAFFSANGDISFYEDTGTTPKFFWDASAEALGIGTTSPSLGSNGSGLHIKGASGEYGVLKVDSSTTSEEGWVQFSNNGVDKFRIASDSSTNLKFIHSGVAERMRIDSSGDMFLGTSSDIAPANGTNLYISDGTISRLGLEKTGTNARKFSINNGGTYLSVYDETADAERMRIDSSGNVGIGITPKTTNATVTGSLNVNQAGLLVRNNNQAYFASNIYWDASDQLKSYSAGYGLASLFIPSDGSHRFFNTTAAATGADQNLTLNETMRIDNSGRVTMPYQPFFSSTWNQSGTGFVTNYNSILVNNGGFTITNGKIYVPVAGYYFINAYGIGTDQFDTRVVANTTGTSPFVFDFRQSDYAGGTHHGCGNGRVFYLASGSYVGIHRLGGTMYVGASASNPHNLISIMLMG